MEEIYYCECGCRLDFEGKRTFIFPREKNAICPSCKTQYKLKGNNLIKKDAIKWH